MSLLIDGLSSMFWVWILVTVCLSHSNEACDELDWLMQKKETLSILVDGFPFSWE